MPNIEPFVRWAGGKTWLIPYMSELIGNIQIEHYHEPFLGGGAVFFSTEHVKKSYLSDANPQLINTYLQVRDNPEDVIHFLENMPNTESDYYQIRDEFTLDNTPINAARFIYLNQTSFNGLYRVNRNGRYNVPYGFRNTWVYHMDRVRSASCKLQNARIEVGDFEINKLKYLQNRLSLFDDRRLFFYINSKL